MDKVPDTFVPTDGPLDAPKRVGKKTIYIFTETPEDAHRAKAVADELRRAGNSVTVNNALIDLGDFTRGCDDVVFMDDVKPWRREKVLSQLVQLAEQRASAESAQKVEERRLENLQRELSGEKKLPVDVPRAAERTGRIPRKQQ